MQYESKVEIEPLIHNDIQRIDDIEIIHLSNKSTILYDKEEKKLIVEKRKYETFIDSINNYIYIMDINKNISIYDLEKRKIIIKDWIIKEKISFDTRNKNNIIFVLRNPQDNSMHIFSPFATRAGDDILNETFKDIKFIRNYPNNLFIVIQEKQGVYSYNVNNKKEIKLEEPLEYDKIECHEFIIIFTKDDYQIAKKRDDLSKKTETYNTIEFEKSDQYVKRHIKCRRGKTIEILQTGIFKKIISSDKYDDINIDHIKEVRYRDRTYDYFLNVEENGLQGIVKTTINLFENVSLPPKIEEIVKMKYHKIIFNGVDYIIIKNDKKGLSIGENLNKKPLESKYDLILRAGINSYLFGINDIYTFAKIIGRDYNPKMTSLIKECKIINYDESDKSFIFEKDDSLGMFFSSFAYGIDDGIIPNEYDKIIKYKNYFYFLIKNGYKKLAEREKIIIDKGYEDIKIGIDEKHYDTYEDKMYFALKEYGVYKLAKRDKKDQPIEIIDNNEYIEIDFIANLIICRDDYFAYIYNFNDKLVAKLPVNTTIEYLENVKKTSYSPVFKINGDYYYYENGKLYPTYIEVRNNYSVKLKMNEQIYTITTYDEEEYKKLIEFIGNNNENEVEEYIESIFSQGTKKSNPSVKIKKII